MSVWACVGLAAARGPGAASFVAGRLESQVEDRTRVQPHDKLGTPVVWPRKLALIQKHREPRSDSSSARAVNARTTPWTGRDAYLK